MSSFLKPFTRLLCLAMASTLLCSGAIAAVVKDDIFAKDESAPFGGVVSETAFKHWLATTDAQLTFVGEPIFDNPLDSRAAQTTMVTYCNKKASGVCGGACTVYNGGATCLSAPGTNCLAATNDVAFCDHSGCSGSCHQLSDCGVHLDNGFCSTPGTNSILVSSA